MHMTRFRNLAAATAVVTIGMASAAQAEAPEVKAVNAAFERDRQAILAMQGDFKVVFRFQETLNFDPNGGKSHDDLSRAHETVQLVEDRGDYISLQHLLVSVEPDQKPIVVKHWRQDWRYEDRSLLEFAGHITWNSNKLSEKEVRGTWTQSVWSVDDSPRYEGIGKWNHVGAYSYWESNDTWRPLPRRETPRKKDYDVIVGKNRHSITPDGWAHEQDNYKLKLDANGNRVIARETGLNTYSRVTDFDFTPAFDYWRKTSGFWELVRTRWDALEAKGGRIEIPTDVEGKSLDRAVSGLATDFGDGKLTKEDAEKSLDADLARCVIIGK